MIDETNKSSSDKILYLLKTGGPETAAALAKTLNITSMGARQHLQNMTDEGLIEYQDVKQGRGRPARYWKTTEAADKLFPNTHSELTLQLINAAEEVFGEDVKFLTYIECSMPDSKDRNSLCKKDNIEKYPTWEFADGTRIEDILSFKKLEKETGCKAPIGGDL